PFGVGYIVLRAAGRIVGAWFGGMVAGTKPVVRHWMGVALMPQAGMATGMGLIAVHHFPGFGVHILSVVVVATVLFELVSPFLIRHAIAVRAGENAGEI
ncbi:MAG TPA: hypothetical protein VNI58_04785, partial [Mariprofundaceae bacterium]|nr:hypothetical protein [Mariprofundaceae bacterium]